MNEWSPATVPFGFRQYSRVVKKQTALHLGLIKSQDKLLAISTLKSHFLLYKMLLRQLLSRVRLFATPRTVACQALLSMEFSRQEYWSGQPFLSLEDLPDPGIKPGFSALQADSLLFELPGRRTLKYYWEIEILLKYETEILLGKPEHLFNQTITHHSKQPTFREVLDSNDS